MTTVSEGIRSFVKENPVYRIHENYITRNMAYENCLGIIVPNDYSYMDMIMKLTQYFDENDVDDENLEMEGMGIAKLGLDDVVYFPCIRGSSC